MTTLKINCDDYDFAPLASAFEEQLESCSPLSAEVIFCSEEDIRSLNSRTRGVDAVTDVLSYPSLALSPGEAISAGAYPLDVDEEGRVFIGSIAVCSKRAEQQAEEFGHSQEREINYLVAHGVCHLLGYDHVEEADKRAMRSAEEAALAKLRLTRD